MDALANAFADVDRMHAHACKAVSSGAPSMLTTGMPTGHLQSNQLTKAAEQYQHYRGWSYVAIKAIAARIAGQDVFCAKLHQAPRQTSKAMGLPGEPPRYVKSLGERLEPLPGHPILESIAAPNALMTQWGLIFSTVASMMLTGRGFWWLAESKDGLQIWPLPTSWLEAADPMRGSWKLRPFGSVESFDIDGRDIVPFALPDPSNPFSAVSPLQSQALAVSCDEEIQSSQFRAFKQGIFPQYAFRVGRMPGMLPGQDGQRPVLSPEQRIELSDAVKRLYSGAHNQGAPLIIDGMIEGVDRLTNGNAEMDWLNSGNQTKERILQSYGVNPAVVGQLENANRASAAVAEDNFCSSTVGPLIELTSQALTRWLGGRFKGEKLAIWIDCCRAHDPEQRLAEWKAARAAGDVTTNEFRRHILNLPDIAGGDVRTDALGNPIGEADEQVA